MTYATFDPAEAGYQTTDPDAGYRPEAYHTPEPSAHPFDNDEAKQQTMNTPAETSDFTLKDILADVYAGGETCVGQMKLLNACDPAFVRTINGAIKAGHKFVSIPTNYAAALYAFSNFYHWMLNTLYEASPEQRLVLLEQLHRADAVPDSSTPTNA